MRALGPRTAIAVLLTLIYLGTYLQRGDAWLALMTTVLAGVGLVVVWILALALEPSPLPRRRMIYRANTRGQVHVDPRLRT